MKKIFLTIQFAALMAGLPAFALVGGPFDNGEYSILNERNGFYQSTFSFKNGSGYAIWTADNLQGVVNTGTAVDNFGTGSLVTSDGGSTNNANRSVLYYKGVTYIGSALGSVDVSARTIQGFSNAFSDFGVAVTTTQSALGLFSAATSSAASSTTVVSSGRNYTANLNWTGKITETTPQLRFSGDGELSIIAPNGAEAIASLAYSGYSNLIAAISASVSQSGAQTGFTGANYTAASASIASILNGSAGTPASQTITPTFTQAVGPTGAAVDVNGNGIFNDDLVQSGQAVANIAAVAGTPSLESYLLGTGPENSYKEAIKEKVKVTGYRRFF
jgi:hypothetical protein